jgi:hypothetical protein
MSAEDAIFTTWRAEVSALRAEVEAWKQRARDENVHRSLAAEAAEEFRAENERLRAENELLRAVEAAARWIEEDGWTPATREALYAALRQI